MSFINYPMTDEDKGKIDFPVYTEKDGNRPTLYKWTTDAERNAFLVLADIEGGGRMQILTRSLDLFWPARLLELDFGLRKIA